MRKWLPTFATLLFFSLTPAARAADPPKDKKPDVAADINKPRADARTVSLDLSEGTWISVDVSPDGRTMIFDLLGDIYAMPIAGGTAKALTSGPAWDCHPRFSPDGKTIAFTSDRSGIENVWTMDADGKNPAGGQRGKGRVRPQRRLDSRRQLPDRAQGGRQARAGSRRSSSGSTTARAAAASS